MNFDRRTFSDRARPCRVCRRPAGARRRSAEGSAILKPGQYALAARHFPSRACSVVVSIPRTARARLSQRRAHRRCRHARPKARPFDADGRFRRPRKGEDASFRPLQRCADAEHEPAYVVGRRAACRTIAGLSGEPRLRACCRSPSRRSCSRSRISARRSSSSGASRPTRGNSSIQAWCWPAAQEFEQALAG